MVSIVRPSDSAVSRNSFTRPYQRFFKRTLDLALVTATLPITLPIIGAISLAICVESKGPAFLRVTRKGRGEKRFRQYRFRCVHVDATDRLSTLGKSVDFASDPRLTMIGRFLLRTRLNTLPQLLNVLMGHMSLVGPQAELMRNVEANPSLGAPTEHTTPGIICASSLPVYAELTDSERNAIAIAYGQNVSLGVDCRVMLHALKQLISADRA